MVNWTPLPVSSNLTAETASYAQPLAAQGLTCSSMSH